MRRKRANPKRAVVQAGSAAASAIPTLDAPSIFATDSGRARPLSEQHRGRVLANLRLIAIGSAERTLHGVLRCERRGRAVVVSLRRGNARIGRALKVRTMDGSRCHDGMLVPEAQFSCEIDEFIGTPWHELSYTSLWTVHGLRTAGKAETFIEH